MPAPAEIVQLVELSERNYDQYRDPMFTEAAVRHQFIDPFFLALGWDVNNAQGFAEQYKEVVHEDKVKMGGATKAPDYSFRIGKERKFFVEAKKPAVDIQHDIEPAYQLRRYAWSAKLPLSILTDFEQLSVYDCRSKPAATDKASAGRILLLNYREYAARWDEIAGVFAKAAVWQGALDKFAEAKAGKRGTAEVDDEFLGEIERWRDLLARNLVLRNPTLRGRDINYAVQQIIDRIVFLRICEARDLETFEQLRSLLNGGHTYDRMQELFRRADLRYNSGLFHFEVEKDRAEAPDTLTPNLAIDDKVLKDIIEHLYSPQSPYEFSVLPADILGHVYERFLGKVIRLTPGRQVKIEEKPEVRKAGGVYYTPTYIVDYIVRQTVGPLLEGKVPGPGRGGVTPPLRILDAACGSGSFLLGAYQFLLDWHLIEYLRDPDHWLRGKRPPLERASGGVLRLSIEERKRIPMPNIYGVDIDPQAVEVTKLSLLLKVLEGEGLAAQMSLLPERVLPDLGRNIKCGNSLIGPEFYDGKLDLPDEDTVNRVNAFDWPREFPEAMAAGGFDAVIGNPPYGTVTDEDIKAYLGSHFETTEGRADTYELFIEKGLKLTRPHGVLGYIVPSPLLTNLYTRNLRRHLLQKHSLLDITNFGMDVFADPTIHTCIVVIRNDQPTEEHTIQVRKQVREPSGLRNPFDYSVLQSALGRNDAASIDVFVDPTVAKIHQRMFSRSVTLSEVAYIRQCIKTGNDPVYVKASATPLEEPWKPTLRGRGMDRYITLDTTLYLKYGTWLARNWQNRSFYETAKLAVRETGSRLVATLDEDHRYFLSSLYSLYWKDPGHAQSLHFLLGILNSKVATFFMKAIALDLTEGAFTKIRTNQLGRLPIPTTDSTDPADVARHDRMVALVTQMLDLHARLAAEGVPHEKAALQRRIEMTDRQIDALVYELYELTPEEIAVVAGATDANG